MARIDDVVKTFIVNQLAMFDTPQQVADAVKERFGVEITRQHVRSYDPESGGKPIKKWRAVFDATRKRFLEQTSDIPIANKSVRLRRLERMAVAAEARKNYPLAAQLHEQAAKECGDLYTNTRKMAHSGAVAGGVLAVPVPLGDEQWTAAASTQQATMMKRPGLSPRVEQ